MFVTAKCSSGLSIEHPQKNNHSILIGFDFKNLVTPISGNMSVPANNPQFFNPPIESGGNALTSWPQLLTHGQQSGIISHVEYQPFKRPRISETMSNPRVVNRSILAIPFKTQHCLQFRRGHCSYGDNCHFAHGTGDIRKLAPNRPDIVAEEGHPVGNWDDNHRIISRMKLCRWFCNGEECPYGDRCHFLHEALEKVKGDLGLSRKSLAISIVTSGSRRDCKSGSDELECNRVVNSSLNANQVYQKQVFRKTRLCNKWETTGNCPYGVKCYFAHGQAELQRLGSHTALESGNDSTSKSLATAKDASTEIETTYEPQVQGKKRLFKWKEIKKISRIYADWLELDDIPLVHG